MKKTIIYNNYIKADTLRLIDENSVIIGILSTKECLAIAEQKDLDLVIVSPDSSPMVAKLCDVQKYQFELNKKEKEKKKNSKQILTKQIKLSLKIDIHDLQTKIKRAKEFLGDGNNVMFFLKLRRKELVKKDQCLLILQKVSKEFEEIAKITKEAEVKTNLGSVTLSPIKIIKKINVKDIKTETAE